MKQHGYILGILQDYIYRDVYGNGNVPHMYVRTFEFLDSWITKVEKSGKIDEVVATIFSDSSKMSYDPSNFIHGSYDAEWGDMRRDMAAVINEGWGTKFFPQIRKDGTRNPAGKPRPFFTHTVEELNKSTHWHKFFADVLRSYGLEVKQSYLK